MSLRFAAVLFSGAALIASAMPAFAIEAEDAADALVAALSGTETKADYDEAKQDGDNVVITGLKLSHGENDALTFSETVIEAPEEGDTGVFDAPSITFKGGTLTGEPAGSIGAAKLTEVTVLDPAEAKGTGPFKSVLFSTSEATDLKVTVKDKPGQVTIGRLYVEVSDVVDNVPQASKGSVEDVAIPGEFFAGSGFTPQMIGYDNLVVGATWDGARDAKANTMTVKDFTLGIKDGGDLSISGVLGKLPPPNALNDPDAAAKASEVEIHTVTVHYADKSLAGRVLDMLAQQQSMSRADYAKQIAAALPFMLAALNNPDFQNKVAGAVGTFLQDPKSLTVKIEPSAPISGGEIMGIVQTAPQSLPDRLNVSITAND
jgi:hypothetical protein